MCVLTFTALAFGSGCVVGAPVGLLAPADPRLETRFHPPPSPLAAMKHYQPVEARTDWGSAPLSPPAQGGKRTGPTGETPGMRGMDMPGMNMGGKP